MLAVFYIDRLGNCRQLNNFQASVFRHRNSIHKEVLKGGTLTEPNTAATVLLLPLKNTMLY